MRSSRPSGNWSRSATASRAAPPRADNQTGPGGWRFERLRPMATLRPLAIITTPTTRSIGLGFPAPVGGTGVVPVDDVLGVGLAEDWLGVAVAVGVGVAPAPTVHAPTGGLMTLSSNVRAAPSAIARPVRILALVFMV